MKKTILLTINKKITLSIVSIFFLLSHSATANTSINVGPVVDKKAPEITVLNTQQQPVSLKQLSREKGLIILFFRSADWCPFCKKHLVELNEQAKNFTQLGYGLAAISYDKTAILKKFSQQEHINYPLLSDQKVKTMSAYNIVNSDYVVGDDHYGIPYPGVVVIDSHGDVIHKHFFKGYKKRVKFADLYLQLKHDIDKK
jgi:peroxiredoxin